MTSVREVMTPDPVVATVPSARRELLKLFLQHEFAGYPVVKVGSKKLVGLVTRQRILDQPDEDQVALLMDPNPPTTYPEAHVREAARTLSASRLRTLPVVTSANDLTGVITPADLLEVLRAHRGLVSTFRANRAVPCHESTPANVAMEALRITRASALPVLDSEGLLSGIVTDGDLLSHAEVTDTIVRSVTGIGGDSDEWTWEGLRDVRRLEHAQTRIDMPRRPVADFMVREVQTVLPTATVGEAAHKMLAGRLSQLPVVDGENRLVDLLYDLDLVAALLN